MAEITDEGYVLKTQNEWFNDERDRYLSIDPNWNLDSSTPDGLKLASDAEIWSALDELGQQAYNSKDPAKAKGNDLDVICSLTGTSRSQGTSSQVLLDLDGVAGTIVIAGKRIKSTVDGTVWALDSTVTLPGSMTATCTTVGAIEASIGTITQIVDTVGGWQTVSNPSVATPGTDIESNSSLRIKRRNAVSRPGSNQVDSTIGEIFAVDGVRKVIAYENDTLVTDSNGQPGKSMAYIVDGGTDYDVANAIYIKKNPGVGLYQAGTPVEVLVTSSTYPSQTKLIKFSRPIYVDMFIDVTIVNDGSLPGTVASEIKNAIVTYAAGGFIADDEGVYAEGFGIGEDVPFSRMYAPIMQVLGSYGNSYVSSLTLNGGTVNVDIAWNELSRWVTDNVKVTIS